MLRGGIHDGGGDDEHLKTDQVQRQVLKLKVTPNFFFVRNLTHLAPSLCEVLSYI